MIFPLRTPFLLRKIYPNYYWKINTNEPKIYLTFDDGPIPEVTPFVLDTLKSYQAKSTFFCIGDNIRKHPEVFRRIEDEGHIAANHTFNHLSGWKTDNESYLLNIEECKAYLSGSNNLFRPPYGRIRKSQAGRLSREYKIIMWDVLTGDFDKGMDPQKCLQRTIKLTRPGSIVVFHDSLKAERVLRYVLPDYLNHFSKLGFQFEILDL
jgi:peptidoglycan/xylan/chitin deacetylase (PgdA/CDA1 family)